MIAYSLVFFFYTLPAPPFQATFPTLGLGSTNGGSKQVSNSKEFLFKKRFGIIKINLVQAAQRMAH